jgi:histidine triad (HIT) family protein
VPVIRKIDMFNHEPTDYVCPFCQLIQGGEGKYNSPKDIIYEDKLVTAFVSPWWWPNNPGNVIIVPNKHFEHIYDLPARYAHRVQDVAKEVALAFKEVYQCDGVSTRQHNEPAGGQDVWHYHLHVFPRYESDNLYQSLAYPEFVPLEKRIMYTQRLKAYFVSKVLKR